MAEIELVIKIDEDEYKARQKWVANPRALINAVDKAIANGTVLPKDATNGDVIKALFPNGSQVKGASIYVMNDNKSNIFYDFDWWNALYKVGDTDKNSICKKS